MGIKKLSNEQEKQLVEEYIAGTPVTTLLTKYGFKSKKSIIDKVKKYHNDDFEQVKEQAKTNRKGYNYKFEKITNNFDAYFLGLLLTDGYIVSNSNKVGLDLADEDCIKFIADSIGIQYHIMKMVEEIENRDIE